MYIRTELSENIFDVDKETVKQLIPKMLHILQI